jgi:hypothetical protein
MSAILCPCVRQDFTVASNVAHLSDCYPGLSIPGVLRAAANWQ